MIEAVLLESIDGIIAGMVVGEDLGEEDRQRDRRGVDALAPEMMAVAASRFDELPRKEFEEGESLLLLELIAQGIELAAGGVVGRLGHGDLLEWCSWQRGRRPAQRVQAGSRPGSKP